MTETAGFRAARTLSADLNGGPVCDLLEVRGSTQRLREIPHGRRSA